VACGGVQLLPACFPCWYSCAENGRQWTQALWRWLVGVGAVVVLFYLSRVVSKTVSLQAVSQHPVAPCAVHGRVAVIPL